MKKTFILFLIISITSCDNSSTLQNVLDSNDVDKIKLKRKEIAESQQEFFGKTRIILNLVMTYLLLLQRSYNSETQQYTSIQVPMDNLTLSQTQKYK